MAKKAKQTKKVSVAAKVRGLLAKGLETAQIAKKLGVNSAYVSQIKWHVANDGKKLKAKKKTGKKTKAVKREDVVIDVPQLSLPLEPAVPVPVAAEDRVNAPFHYTVGGIETWDYIAAKELNYNLGNVVKYVSRADYVEDDIEDLKKAVKYLQREITHRESGRYA